jgi:hypothetical protein
MLPKLAVNGTGGGGGSVIAVGVLGKIGSVTGGRLVTSATLARAVTLDMFPPA